jgi:hypothetical protein
MWIERIIPEAEITGDKIAGATLFHKRRQE